MITIDITQVEAIMTLSKIPHKITGWSDSADCLSLPDSSELNQVKKGADGKMVSSSTGEKGGEVSVKVLPNSPFVDRMSAEIELIKQGVQIPIELLVTNTTVGDVTVCTGGALKSAPVGLTYGKGEVGEMVYVFEFERIVFAPVGSKRDSALSTLTGGLVG
jgi:hypothetical protein